MWVNPDTKEWVDTLTTYVRPDGTIAAEGHVKVKGGFWLNLRTGKVHRRKPTKPTRQRTHGRRRGATTKKAWRQ